MADKKAYPLRINARVIEAMQRWADDDLRSLNAQIEFVLRDALRSSGRLKHLPADAAGSTDADTGETRDQAPSDD